MSRNDLANRALYSLQDPDGALSELERALQAAGRDGAGNAFARGVILCTRAEVRLARGEADAALDDARSAMTSLQRAGGEGGTPNPYLYGMTVCVEVKALLAAGRADEAWRAGRTAVDRLGEAVPQARSMILADVAAALAAADRGADAYRALLESAELERLAYRELTELHRDFERAVIEQDAALREAEALAVKNRELEATLDELAATHRELEALQAQLREHAERDWLTGCYNRRYLATTLEEIGAEHAPLSVAVLDLDRFKSVNDRFGHVAGDEVLREIARQLQRTCREQDTVVRQGGDEFCVLAPETGWREAEKLAERLGYAIARAVGGLQGLTASIGFAVFPDEGATAEVLIARADANETDAKRRARQARPELERSAA
jgi:diguanylate cyclase (GGDEF)-like protein